MKCGTFPDPLQWIIKPIKAWTSRYENTPFMVLISTRQGTKSCQIFVCILAINVSIHMRLIKPYLRMYSCKVHVNIARADWHIPRDRTWRCIIRNVRSISQTFIRLSTNNSWVIIWYQIHFTHTLQSIQNIIHLN
jgi:hypothetical protein